jgi:DHA2 family multidrug resistance protein-like MFS transporter
MGFGFFQTPNNRIMLTSAPHERSGAAGGLMTMSRMVGMTFGAALAAMVFDICGPHGASVALFFGAISSAMGVVVGAVRMTRAR